MPLRPHHLAIALAVAMLAGCSHGTPSTTVKSSPSPTSHRHTNRLDQQKSPYLLQHAHNPVDWFPWGEEAFAKARAEGKPIFLSIGYSTCHWCHVMERESFENEDVAKFLNELFVSIKLDREERPDVDKIYMTAVQAMGQGGGWPLNVFLTSDLKPFYGGTYFPPEPKYGRPSFLQILGKVADVWKNRRGEVSDQADVLHAKLEMFTNTRPTNSVELSPALLTSALAAMKEQFEPRYGGFGDAPKFPRPMQPLFVLRQGVRQHDDEAINAVLFTCERMAAGGMNDQLGGGFARYSTDAKWLVPHFEKMLYDNAQLVQLYLDAHLVSGRADFAEVARDVLRYVQRDMTHPQGGFYSAEDADSEGKEGKFYCWTEAELKALLTPEEFAVAKRVFGITAKGNFLDHSDPNPLPDQNVLSLVDPKLSATEKPMLDSAKAKMFAERAKRIRPHLDDKVLTSWNGMMLGAYARAGAVLNDPSYIAAAEKNLKFIRGTMWDAKTKTLYSRWRDGERDQVQLLDAYANLLAGTLELYSATLEADHLAFAIDLAEAMLKRFHDPEHGGFWQSADGTKDLILRVKEDYDGAEPSGNSTATLALLKLAAITERKDFRAAAEGTLRLFSSHLTDRPLGVPQLLTALDFAMEEPRRVVLVGDPKSPEFRKLIAAAHATYQPNKVILGQAGPVEAFAKTLPKHGPATAYVCTGTACQPPTDKAEKLVKLLR